AVAVVRGVKGVQLVRVEVERMHRVRAVGPPDRKFIRLEIGADERTHRHRLLLPDKVLDLASLALRSVDQHGPARRVAPRAPACNPKNRAPGAGTGLAGRSG